MAPPQEPADADAPVMCETICRPINETEQLLAGAAGVYAKHAGNPEENAEAKAVKETVEGGSPEATMLLQLSRKVCTMHGGKYDDHSGECEPFMRSTQAAVQYGACAPASTGWGLRPLLPCIERAVRAVRLTLAPPPRPPRAPRRRGHLLGLPDRARLLVCALQPVPGAGPGAPGERPRRVPWVRRDLRPPHAHFLCACSPAQFEIPDHAYYWLWPGGRFDQVSQAVFKQEAGHNPHTGMDKCKDGHHVGFFHNWDQAHVDSWGCLQDNSSLRVLCCRRN